MEQPFHQPGDAKAEHDSQRQYSICVLPNLFNRICKHQADASGSEAQEVNADDQSVIMDDLQIGVMGMDANGAVRQQNAAAKHAAAAVTNTAARRPNRRVFRMHAFAPPAQGLAARLPRNMLFSVGYSFLFIVIKSLARFTKLKLLYT